MGDGQVGGGDTTQPMDSLGSALRWSAVLFAMHPLLRSSLSGLFSSFRGNEDAEQFERGGRRAGAGGLRGGRGAGGRRAGPRPLRVASPLFGPAKASTAP